MQATKQKYMRKLERVFHEVDTSGDGLISEDEFRSMMEDSSGTMPSFKTASSRELKTAHGCLYRNSIIMYILICSL